MSTSSLPTLPEPPRPDRFQFSLKSILATMALLAIGLAGVRALGLFTLQVSESSRLPPKGQIMAHLFGILLAGGLIYLCIRLPYLWTYLESRYNYARQLTTHKRQLLAWAEETKAAKKKERELAEKQTG